MLEFGDIITLENNKKYVVASTCTYNDKFFIYVVNESDSLDCIIGTVQDDNFQEINDEKTFVEVMPLLLDNIDDSILEDGGENNE